MMRAALEVADVLRRHGPTYREVHADSLSREQYRVMTAIEQCRTAALGGHVEQCDSCGHQRIAYNSCGNRHCPKCQSLARAQWLEDRQADVLPVPYFHVVFTLPEKIASIAFQNKRVVYDLLFQATAETLHTIAADPHHLGATIGFIAILHTWGQNLVHHPHLHCVVPGGGLAPDGSRWVACKPGFFLPVRVLSRLFRRLFLERLEHAFDMGELRFFSSLAPLAERGEFAHYLAGARHAEWVVYAKEPFGGPEQVLDYLGRYTHRVAISNNRLVGLTDGHVTFRWKDYRHPGRPRLMRLDAHEFIRRFLLHVLPRGLQRIRHYGLLCNRLRESRLSVCRHLLNVEPTSDTCSAPEPDYRDRYAKLTGRSLHDCPVCSRGRMLCIERLLPGAPPRAPPANPR
ncbi:IS91 family transposase [Caballeronia sp. Lep1P3]|uniref:IS91 family transposase n=1 Tax=Caballeronia sp. Lep1P3 TaxID=2878150 RepID=UPI00025B9DB4|nr:IS91 family transposase [Caballeronia sp. Lep1P3]EKS72777.1 transposase [Burkholderia sp. SJ98]